MIITKTERFCDVCGEAIGCISQRFSLSNRKYLFAFKYGQDCLSYDDICDNCYMSIYDFVISLKKDKNGSN